MAKSKQKTIKVFICPKCKSFDVYHPLGFSSLWGLFPKWRCKSCDFNSLLFPQIVIEESKLKKLNEKALAKKSKKKTKRRNKK